MQRLTDLEQICRSYDGVGKAHAIQAGREVRILVKPTEVDDLAALRLARDIAKKVEEQLTFPGQIKVLLSRKFEASAVA